MARKNIAPPPKSGASPSRSGSFLSWLAWSLIVLITDQFTKVLVAGYYKLGDSISVTSFLNLVRVHNTGAAFSLLADASGWQRWMFIAIGVVAIVAIVALLWAHAAQKLFAFSLASILGGAIGNMADRLTHGYVVDFLDFYWRGWHFPAFNVADAAITAGTVGLILDELLRVRRSRS